jgi:hypothetical protein
MSAPRRSLIFPVISADCPPRRDNLVGSIASRIGAAALFGSILTACGARSDLVDGVALEPQYDPGDSCMQAPTTPFTKRFGDGMGQVGASIAVDRNGYPVIAGAFHGALDLGVATLDAPAVPPSPGDLFPQPPLALEGSFFVARLAPAGCAPFARAFDGIDNPTGIQVVLAGDGAVLLTATYVGVVNFGGGPVNGNSSSTAIAKLTASGDHVWSHGFHADQLIVTHPATDAQGDVYVAGFFGGWLAFDHTVLGKAHTGHDGFVAKLDPSGALVWSKILALHSQPVAGANLSVAAWPEGDVAVAGQIVVAEPGVADLGAGPVNVPHQTGFVTSFDASGQHRWQSLISPLITDAQLAPSGDLVVLGMWGGNGFPIQRFDTTGATSAPVVVGAPAAIPSLAVGPNDEALIAAPLGAPGNGLFAAAVAASGEVLWTRTFNAQSEDGNYRVAGAFGPSGTPLLAGGFMGTMDLGTGAISADGIAPDVFVAALLP